MKKRTIKTRINSSIYASLTISKRLDAMTSFTGVPRMALRPLLSSQMSSTCWMPEGKSVSLFTRVITPYQGAPQCLTRSPGFIDDLQCAPSLVHHPDVPRPVNFNVSSPAGGTRHRDHDPCGALEHFRLTIASIGPFLYDHQITYFHLLPVLKTFRGTLTSFRLSCRHCIDLWVSQ